MPVKGSLNLPVGRRIRLVSVPLLSTAANSLPAGSSTSSRADDSGNPFCACRNTSYSSPTAPVNVNSSTSPGNPMSSPMTVSPPAIVEGTCSGRGSMAYRYSR